MEGELAVGEPLPKRVLESYLDGGLLVQLQTLGGQRDENVRSLGRRGRRIETVDEFVLNDTSHMISLHGTYDYYASRYAIHNKYYIIVAVPYRNQRLFRRVSQSHRCLRSAVSLNFR